MNTRSALILTAFAAAGIALTGCSTDATPAPPAQPAQPAQQAPPQPGAAPAAVQAPAATTKDKAAQIATAQFGGQVINVEPDTAQGAPSWEVELRNTTQGRIEVDISQQTGAIVEQETD